MKNRFHQHAKVEPRKDSLVDFISRFSDKNKHVEFLMSIKFPGDSYATDANAMSTISSREGHQERIYPSVQGMRQAAYLAWWHYP